VVLKADSRISRGSGKRYDTRQIVSATEQVELDTGEDGEQRESIDEGEGPGDC